MIRPRTVLALGFSQLVCWGTTYYLVGVFGEAIAGSLHWSRTLVHARFSWALLVMGFSSAAVGRAIDRHGGRPVMSLGSALTAAGCALLAVTQHVAVYFAAWTLLGLAMRMTLYDAAFAALARIGGGTARRPISQITLRRPSGPSATSWTSSSVGAALFWSTPPWRSSSPCRFT